MNEPLDLPAFLRPQADRNAGTVVPATGPLSLDEREWMRLYERGLAARAKVEDELLRAARGADPMPDAAKLRQWAQRLGVPTVETKTKPCPNYADGEHRFSRISRPPQCECGATFYPSYP